MGAGVIVLVEQVLDVELERQRIGGVEKHRGIDAGVGGQDHDVAPVIGPDGKKILPDLPDEQFEKDVKVDPTIKEDEKKASFVVSSADDTSVTVEPTT